MRTVMLFTKGEKVNVDFVIDSLLLNEGEVFYRLKDPRNGKIYDYAFSADELTPVPGEEEKAVVAHE